jgi:hypothetical protein
MPGDINFQELLTNVNDNPHHQRTIRRILSMPQDQRAIADRIVADEAFADDETKKLFTLAKMGEDKSFRDKTFDEKNRQFDAQLKLKYDELATRKSLVDAQNEIVAATKSYTSWANPLAHVIGAGGLGITGYNAWNNAKRAETLSNYATDDNILKILGR